MKDTAALLASLSVLAGGGLLAGCSGDTGVEGPGSVDVQMVGDSTAPDGQGPETAEPDQSEVPLATCTQYCTAVQVACTGDDAQYQGADACEAFCQTGARLPAGSTEQPTGNTIACRLAAAEAAAGGGDVSASCAAAGPSGGGICGTFCETYCHIMLEACPGTFADAASCAAACNAYPAGKQTGDSLACRVDQAVLAALEPASASAHCAGASPGGGDLCTDPPPVPTCEGYCAKVTAACKGANAQFGGQAACIEWCSELAQVPPGTPEDAGGNTIGCRTHHAALAAAAPAEAATHCLHAGPTGGDVCGTWCENYCHLALSNCTGSHTLYGEEPTCLAACSYFRPDGAPGDDSGDSVQCRLTHVTLAAKDPAGHCPPGGIDGGGICVAPTPSCDAYCQSVMAACTGDDAQYEDEPTCLALCAEWAAFEPGTYYDDAVNTIGCRWLHARLAAAEPEKAAVHCGPAGPSGGGVCGDYCEVYCALALSNCGGDEQIFPDEPTCQDACSAISTAGSPGELSGDSIQCRIAHLALAASEPEGAAQAEHCPAGSPGGGKVCVPPPPTCGEYCAAVTAACTGESAQYDSEQACVETCVKLAKLPGGTGADTEGNTLGCRTYHAALAAEEPEEAPTYCTYAGPTGGNVCGTWCDVYCHLSWTNCQGDYAPFEDTAACQKACQQFPAGGAPGDSSGDTVQCRITHLILAGESKPETAVEHCPAASVVGGGVCVVPGSVCEAPFVVGALPFSAANDTAGSTASYAYGAGECPGEAKGWGAGSSDHAYAFTPPEDGQYVFTLVPEYDSNLYVVGDCTDIAGSCAGANDLVGKGVVESLTLELDAGSTWYVIVDGWSNFEDSSGPYTLTVEMLGKPTCAEYCAKMAACPTQYAGEAECLTFCAQAKLPAGKATDTSGNTLGCRTSHADLAVSDPGKAAEHCLHAGPTGGNVCGSWCENLCHLVETSCPGEDAPFAGNQECMEACAAYPSGGAPGATGGSSVQCRLTHLGMAAKAPEEKCPAATPAGGGLCPIPGDTCAVALPVGPLPFSTSGDTSGATGDYHYEAGSCPGEEKGWGAASNDVAYAFTPPEAGRFRVTLVGSGTFDSNLYVVGICESVKTTCLGASDLLTPGQTEAVVLDLDAGETVFVIVDGWSNKENVAGQYTLSVEEVVPTCAGYCQAVTAACTGPLAQYAGGNAACLAYCGGAAKLPAGSVYDVGGNTIGCRTHHAGLAAASPAAAAASCGKAGPTGGNACGTWCDNYCHLAVANCTGGNALYADLASCAAACASIPAGGQPGDVAGDTVQCRLVHLGIAGQQPPSKAAVHCPFAAPDGGGVCVADAGDTCGTAIPIDSFPFQTTGSTSDAKSDYGFDAGECPGVPGARGGASSDEVYAVSPKATAVHTFTLKADFDSTLYVVSGCADITTSCIAAADKTGPGKTEQLALELLAGKTYYVIVDGWGSVENVTGSYTLGVEVDLPPVPGDTCETAFAVGALPFEASGDTTGAANDYGYGAGQCPGEEKGWGGGSNEHVYAFTPPADGQYRVTLVGEGELDTNLYVVSDCSSIATTCLGADDQVGAAVPEELTLALKASEPVFIVVDGWKNSGNVAGKYSLSVEVAPPPVFEMVDLSGFIIQQVESEKTFVLPKGTLVPVSGALVVGRKGEKSAFEAFWKVAMGTKAVYLDGGDELPTINGKEQYTLKEPLGSVLDGPTIPGVAGKGYIRKVPVGPAELAGSWTEVAADSGAATPGAVPVVTDAPAVYISEWSDALGSANFVYEFVEIHVAGVPDLPQPTPTFASVAPVFQARCAVCHTTGGQGGHNIGAADLAAAYADSQKPSSSVPGATIGAAALVRLKAGEMPPGDICSGDPAVDHGDPACLTEQEQELLGAWIDGGQLGP